MKDISTEVIGEIGHPDFGGGTVNTNGANKEPHRSFEVGKRMFNEGPELLVWLARRLSSHARVRYFFGLRLAAFALGLTYRPSAQRHTCQYQPGSSKGGLGSQPLYQSAHQKRTTRLAQKC